MTRTIRLTDLQLVMLSSAAARDTGSLVPLPASCKQDTSAIDKAVTSLLRRKLVEEIIVTDRVLCWREKNQDLIGLFITATGRAAISVDEDLEAQAAGKTNAEAGNDKSAPIAGDDAKPDASSPARSGSKIATVVALLERDEGATLDELVAATAWLPHTTRAALTGLRNKGRTITKTKRGMVTCYRIATEHAA